MISHARSRSAVQHGRAFSIVGLLITMVCIVVLFSILMTSMNKAVTGEGTQQPGTVRSFEDKMYLYSIYTSMLSDAGDNRGRYTTPSEVSGSRDGTQNTTANLFSAMVMQRFVPPKQLVSGNEYSPYVDVCEDYDFTAYNPNQRVWWDPNFKADLSDLSHTSFAHLPLYGERLERQWRSTMDSRSPLLGNRGPKDGVNSKDSWACGRDGMWRGHIVFGDGHIEFIDTPFHGPSYTDRGETYPDNLFTMETGPNGDDAVLSFTKRMTAQGPDLQWD